MPVSHPRIVVAGAGRIGCYVGGCLGLVGHDVTLLLRAPIAEAISTHGLRISDLEGSDRCLASSAISRETDPGPALQHADVILLTVKCGATRAMAELIARHAPSRATVVSLQNGIGNVEALRARLRPEQRIVPGMVPFNVVRHCNEGKAPRFRRSTSGTILIGPEHPGLCDALNVAGVPVAEHADMTGVLWGKLLLNLNNALNALSGLPLAEQLADRRWRSVLAAQIEEALAILQTAGVRPRPIDGVHPRMIPVALRLPNPLFRLPAGRMLAIDPLARSSMWDDLEERRPTDVDDIQGAVLALAAKTAMAAPLTQRIKALMKTAEAAGRGSPRVAPHVLQVAT